MKKRPASSSDQVPRRFGRRAQGRARSVFARDVARGLAASPKQLESKYLYDALGSALFEAICHLPWYRITRGEHRLLARHGAGIAAALGDMAWIAELGSGSGEKLATLARRFVRRGRRTRVHLIDISATAISLARRTLAEIESVDVTADRATYEAGLRRLRAVRPPDGRALVLLLGSNIGNFDWPAACGFMERIRDALSPGDCLLLGTDLVKPEAELLLAYDDPLGVTAAFNKNLLARINAELGADFDLGAFDHRAIWRPEASRVEMHLVSRCDQRVSVPAAGCEAVFREGEWIWTESSYKYEPEAVSALGRIARFRQRRQWIDRASGFALTLLEAE